MRIVYMGTPDIAVPVLQSLAKSEYEVAAVFTQPDKPKGRGHHMIPTPVKAAAQEYDIPVYQPLSLRKGEDAEQAMETLRQANPDIIVVMAYGQILPKEVLELPKYGCINLHASLLPAYRGAAPIQWAIMDGQKETGITVMQMAEGLDTGDMLLKKVTPIDPEETADPLMERLAQLAAEATLEVLPKIVAGEIQPEVQDDSLSNYAIRITKDMSRLDFQEDAQKLHDKIRGITGFTTLEGKRLKIYASRVTSGKGEPGEIIDAEKFVVACGAGTALQFVEIQPEGKKRMQVADYLRGKALEKGVVLGKEE